MSAATFEPGYVASPAEFKAWLATHHRTADEVLVVFHEKHTGTPTLTWPESVDEALCGPSLHSG